MSGQPARWGHVGDGVTADPIDSWSCPTTVHVGVGRAGEVLTESAGRARIVVTDATVAGAQAQLLARLEPAAVVVRAAGEADLALLDRILAARRVRPDAALVGVGGGSVLDVTKLAALAGRDPAAGAALRTALGGHDGLLLWPAESRQAVADVVCVPATIGTATEVSPIAVLRRDDRLVMVGGAGLRPRVAILDADVTATVDPAVLVAGLAEAYARAVVPAVAGAALPVQDGIAGALGALLLRLAQAAASAGDAGWREAAAVASAQTHLALAAVGRGPFGHVLWPVATEVAAATGAPKGAVLAALLPAWLDCLATGTAGPVLGDALRAVTVTGAPPAVTATRLRAAFQPVADPWRPVLAALPVDATVAAVVRRWQSGGFFLRGATGADLTALLAALVSG